MCIRDRGGGAEILVLAELCGSGRIGIDLVAATALGIDLSLIHIYLRRHGIRRLPRLQQCLGLLDLGPSVHGQLLGASVRRAVVLLPDLR